MAGIDYKAAGLGVREKFALAGEKTGAVIAGFMGLPYIKGCVVISTCNRTEIYVSIEPGRDFSIPDFLCGLLGLDPSLFNGRFTERNEKEAFFHLCGVAAGLDSQILGDDQIITQAREALELSRRLGYTDSYLETAFRTAVKAAKEIKTNVMIRPPQIATAPYKAVERLKGLTGVKGKRAVVIGNGQMGRLSAGLLLAEGAEVTVTLREYKKGVVKVPEGAKTIGYGSRYEAIERAQVVLSATSSPHYTLRLDDFLELGAKPGVVVDLAVPRDAEPGIGELPGVTLLTIDDLGDGLAVLPEEKLSLAAGIIEKNFEGYDKWRSYRENIL